MSTRFCALIDPEPKPIPCVRNTSKLSQFVYFLLPPEVHVSFQWYQGFCLLEDCVKLPLCFTTFCDTTETYYSPSQRPLVKIVWFRLIRTTKTIIQVTLSREEYHPYKKIYGQSLEGYLCSKRRERERLLRMGALLGGLVWRTDLYVNVPHLLNLFDLDMKWCCSYGLNMVILSQKAKPLITNS